MEAQLAGQLRPVLQRRTFATLAIGVLAPPAGAQGNYPDKPITMVVPAAGAKERAKFLRWLVFIVANIYPTFTYADDPARFISVNTARDPFRAATDAYAQRLWHQIEGEAGSPWFLGERFSALDIYLGVMTRWRPKRGWFENETPKLFAIARRADQVPELAPVWKRNWPAG